MSTNSMPMSVMPDRLAVPTLQPYDRAMTENGGGASVHRFKNPRDRERIATKNGRLVYGEPGSEKDVTCEDLSGLFLRPEEGDENVDVRLLDMLYTIVLYNAWVRNRDENGKMIKEVLAPEFAEHDVTVKLVSLVHMGGRSRSQSVGYKKSVHESFKRLKGMVGTIRGAGDTNLQVVSRLSFGENPNTITFCSPYISEIIARVMRAAGKEAEKTKTGSLPPNHHYMIRTTAAKRNAIAYNVMRSAVNSIVQADKMPVTVRMKNVVKDDPDLERAMARAATIQYRGVILKRAFVQGWELLRDNTDLTERYKNIVLPDPDNRSAIPINRTLEGMAINITHDGPEPEKQESAAGAMMLEGWREVAVEEEESGKRSKEQQELKHLLPDPEIESPQVPFEREDG